MTDDIESARLIAAGAPADARSGAVRGSARATDSRESTGTEGTVGDHSGFERQSSAVLAEQSQRIDALLAVTRAVTECDTRDAAERTACERLVDSALYRSAWIGVPALDGGGVAVRASAGFDRDGCEAPPPVSDHGGPSHRRPWRQALRTGSVRVVDAAAFEFADWSGPAGEGVNGSEGRDRDASEGEESTAPTGGTGGTVSSDVGVERGVGERERQPNGGVAAIPLGSGDTVDGVLVVQVPDPVTVSDRERTVLGSLGNVLGNVVDAVKSRELVFAENCVEVECRLTHDASFLVRASDALDCALTVEGYVAVADGWRLFCDVEGSGADALAAAVADDPDVADCRTIVDREDGCWVTIETAGASVLDRAVAAGASVRSVVADGGVCRVCLDLPRSGDVRETVARLRGTYPELELLSRRDVDRSPAEPTASIGVFDELTDRQREVLEAVYRAGYFEWPRENTAEDIAPELGIASSTLHWHLREAERRLFESLFD